MPNAATERPPRTGRNDGGFAAWPDAKGRRDADKVWEREGLAPRIILFS